MNNSLFLSRSVTLVPVREEAYPGGVPQGVRVDAHRGGGRRHAEQGGRPGGRGGPHPARPQEDPTQTTGQRQRTGKTHRTGVIGNQGVTQIGFVV